MCLLLLPLGHAARFGRKTERVVGAVGFVAEGEGRLIEGVGADVIRICNRRPLNRIKQVLAQGQGLELLLRAIERLHFV